jgi:hypothetical protein
MLAVQLVGREEEKVIIACQRAVELATHTPKAHTEKKKVTACVHRVNSSTSDVVTLENEQYWLIRLAVCVVISTCGSPRDHPFPWQLDRSHESARRSDAARVGVASERRSRTNNLAGARLCSCVRGGLPNKSAAPVARGGGRTYVVAARNHRRELRFLHMPPKRCFLPCTPDREVRERTRPARAALALVQRAIKC